MSVQIRAVMIRSQNFKKQLSYADYLIRVVISSSS